MKKSWLLPLAAFALGIFCGGALLSRPAAAGQQPEPARRETAQQAPAVEPPEGETLQLGHGGEDWAYWGFQWQDSAFRYARPPEWGVEQQGAWACLPNREDSPDWGLTLSTPDGQEEIQILGHIRPRPVTVPGQQKSYSLSRAGQIVGQAMFGRQDGQVFLMAGFATPGSAGFSLTALVRMPEAQWQQYQDRVLDILGEIYPVDAEYASRRE